MEEAGGKRWKGTDPPVSSDQQAIQPSELCNGSVNKRGFCAVESRSPIPDREPGRVLASPCAFGITPADRRLRADIWPQAAGLITLGSRWDSGTAGAAKTGCKPSRGDWRLVR